MYVREQRRRSPNPGISGSCLPAVAGHPLSSRSLRVGRNVSSTLPLLTFNFEPSFVFKSFSYNSLPPLFYDSPLFSIACSLFCIFPKEEPRKPPRIMGMPPLAKNMGVGYPPSNQLLLFSSLQTLCKNTCSPRGNEFAPARRAEQQSSDAPEPQVTTSLHQ